MILNLLARNSGRGSYVSEWEMLMSGSMRAGEVVEMSDLVGELEGDG